MQHDETTTLACGGELKLASLAAITGWLGRRRALVLLDDGVAERFGAAFAGLDVLRMACGEANKTLENAQRVYQALMAREFDRSDWLVGVGGGALCDLAGFVAATYKRGMRFALAPTTLLAMVDAAIGGKNALNVGDAKNSVGTVYMPEAVWVDPTFCDDLPADQWRAGMAELIKTAAVADGELFERLEANSGLDAEARLGAERAELIRLAALSKARVVAADLHDTGARRVLNFGHGLAHALERAAGMPHGQAVAVGMGRMVAVSMERKLCKPADASRVLDLVAAAGLDIRLPSLDAPLARWLRQDKKRSGQRITEIFYRSPGQTRLETLDVDDWLELLT